jgi:hypothetical protein
MSGAIGDDENAASRDAGTREPSSTGDVNSWIRVAVVCVISAMAVVVAGMRRRREERLARMTAIAEATQLALLPPLPAQMIGVNIAAATALRHTRPQSAVICTRSSPPGRSAA